MTIKKTLKIILILALAMPLAYCAFAKGYHGGAEFSGALTDFDSGKPLSDVYVVWHWEGRQSLGFVDSQSICYRSAIAKTDSDGRYRFPAWLTFNLGLPYIYDKKDSVHVVFKPGYSNSFTVTSASRGYEFRPIDFKLPKFIGSEEEYIEVLFRAYGGAVCTYQQSTIDRKQKQQMIDYLMVIQGEAMKLTSAKNKQRLIDACQDLINQYKQY